MSLRKKTLSGIAWTFGQQVGVQGINFIVQIILARLLLPSDFGLIAMIQIFLAIGKTLMDSGMTSSLIRTENADQRDYSTVFFINLFASIGLYLLLFFTAPLIASFFNQELLTLIIRVYTLSFVIQALVGVQTTRLTKEMNFKLQMYMQIPSTLCGGIAGVILAYKGYGVWSLVWMQLITTTIFMVQHWLRLKWRPSLIIDRQKMKHHLSFGYKITLSALLTTFYYESNTILLGKFFSSAQLGFYKQASNLRMFPLRNITSALQKVTYPMFSSIQNENEKIRTIFKRITSVVFFVMVPIMLLMTLVAEPLFRIVLTDKWLPSVPIFQILCVFSIFYPLSMYNLNLILAKGRSDLHFKLEVIKKGISICFLLLIIPFGVHGVAYAAGIGMLIHAFVNSLYSGRLIQYPVLEQFKDISNILIIGFFSMGITFVFNKLFIIPSDYGDIFIILIVSLVFIILYISISFLFRVTAINEIKVLIKHFMNKA